MNDNKSVIEKFYSSFQRLHAAGMNACYSDEIIFSDPVFGLLKGDDVKVMWEMLCAHAKDFSLTFTEIELLDEEYATCRWEAVYTFSNTGRKVTNKIKAFMRLRDGKIIEHSDAFRLSSWLAQAFGWKGILFGWTGFMKRAAQKNARKQLRNYIERHYPDQLADPA